MDRAQREQMIKDMLVKIRSDFGKMDDLLNPEIQIGGQAAEASRAYLQRQIGKYLKPLNSNGFRTQAKKLMTALQIPALLNVADDAGAIPFKKPNWDTEGVSTDHVNWKLNLGGGWAVKGMMGGVKIRVNQKAFWMFPELTLRGVMVHEATHFALDTDDIHYSTFTRNSEMQALDNGSENADNWRIFYQKMSEHFSHGMMA